MPQVQFKLVENGEERDVGSVLVNNVRLAEAAKQVGIVKPQKYTVKKGKSEKVNWFTHIGYMDQVYYLSLKTGADSSFSSSRAGNLTIGSETGNFFDQGEISTSSPRHFSSVNSPVVPVEKTQLFTDACQPSPLIFDAQTGPLGDNLNPYLKMRLKEKVDNSEEIMGTSDFSNGQGRFADESYHFTPIKEHRLTGLSNDLDSSHIDKLTTIFSKEMRLSKEVDKSEEIMDVLDSVPICSPDSRFEDGIHQSLDTQIENHQPIDTQPQIENSQPSDPSNALNFLDEDVQKSSECDELPLDVTQSSFHDEDLYSEMPLEVSFDVTQLSFYDEDPKPEIPLDVPQQIFHAESPSTANQSIPQNIGQSWLHALNEFMLFRMLTRPVFMFL